MRNIARIGALFVMLAAAGWAADGQVSADAVLGKWQNEEAKGTFEIYKKGDTFEGKIVALHEEKYPADDPEAGVTKHDRHNPDKALQARPIIGIVFLEGFTFDGEKWSGGTIYDPESGKTYKCKMTLKGDTLDVRGYIGTPLLGRTEVWTRVKEAAK